MEFCISRIEHYKASSASGVFRESSRDLSKYPNDVDCALSGNNVVLVQEIDPHKEIVSEIKTLKDALGVGGRFTLKGGEKSQTNIMSQVFFKLPPEFLVDKSKQEICDCYADLLQWFCDKHPTFYVIGAYIHFDEPDAGIHMHVNGLPLFEDKEKNRLIFSSSKLFPGKDYYQHYQDDLHRFACQHFDYDFSRRKAVQDKAKHLSVPEYKEAMRELEKIENRVKSYQPVQACFDEIDNAGRRRMFGDGFTVTDTEMDLLKSAAESGVKHQWEIDRLQKENDRIRAEQMRLQEEHSKTKKLYKTLLEFCRGLGKDFWSDFNIFAKSRVNNKSITINGNGFTINALKNSRIFNINASSNIFLNNIIKSIIS